MEELLLLPSADMSTQASQKPSEAPRSVSVAGARSGRSDPTLRLCPEPPWAPGPQGDSDSPSDSCKHPVPSSLGTFIKRINRCVAAFHVKQCKQWPYIHTHSHTVMHTQTHSHTNTFTFTHTLIHSHSQSHKHRHIHTETHSSTFTLTQTHTHTHTS